MHLRGIKSSLIVFKSPLFRSTSVVEWHWPGEAEQYRKPVEMREKMIRDTNAFLSWSLSKDRQLPRIARRRVDLGGFEAMLRHPGARALMTRWWKRVLEDHRIEL